MSELFELGTEQERSQALRRASLDSEVGLVSLQRGVHRVSTNMRLLKLFLGRGELRTKPVCCGCQRSSCGLLLLHVQQRDLIKAADHGMFPDHGWCHLHVWPVVTSRGRSVRPARSSQGLLASMFWTIVTWKFFQQKWV